MSVRIEDVEWDFDAKSQYTKIYRINQIYSY